MTEKKSKSTATKSTTKKQPMRKWSDMTYHERLVAFANSEREATSRVPDARQRTTLMIVATGFLAMSEALSKTVNN